MLESGKTVVSFHASEHFPMQSVYKLPIGMAALHEVDRGALKLDQVVRVDKREYISTRQYSPLRDANPNGAEVTVRELLRLAVSESDGTASDVLLRLIGGPPAVMQFLRHVESTRVKCVTRRCAWGRTIACSTPTGPRRMGRSPCCARSRSRAGCRLPAGNCC